MAIDAADFALPFIIGLVGIRHHRGPHESRGTTYTSHISLLRPPSCGCSQILVEPRTSLVQLPLRQSHFPQCRKLSYGMFLRCEIYSVSF